MVCGTPVKRETRKTRRFSKTSLRFAWRNRGTKQVTTQTLTTLESRWRAVPGVTL
jgi:hypothetical protein